MVQTKPLGPNMVWFPCSPKAEVTGSNPVGCAIFFNDLVFCKTALFGTNVPNT